MQYYIYILANLSKTLYIGVTNNLERQLYEHRMKFVPGFTRAYNITMLVYFEITSDIQSAREREKQVKGWKRERKITLIKATNPEWRDLSFDWK